MFEHPCILASRWCWDCSSGQGTRKEHSPRATSMHSKKGLHFLKRSFWLACDLHIRIKQLASQISSYHWLRHHNSVAWLCPEFWLASNEDQLRSRLLWHPNEHYGVCPCMLQWHQEGYILDPADQWLRLLPLTLDLSSLPFCIPPPLLVGHALVKMGRKLMLCPQWWNNLQSNNNRKVWWYFGNRNYKA